MGDNIVIGPGQIYIDGGPLGGVEAFTCDLEEVFDEHRDEFLTISEINEATLTFKMKFNKLAFYKITGLYDWVYSNCPNRRVKHLIKHGKTRRVRWKNFNRALHIIGRKLDHVSR